MATLQIETSGAVCLEIADADGECHLYRVAPLPRGLARLRLSLKRVDTGAEYVVRLDPPLKWDCDCPLQQKGRRDLKPCKHIREVAGVWAGDEDLYALAAALRAARQTTRSA